MKFTLLPILTFIVLSCSKKQESTDITYPIKIAGSDSTKSGDDYNALFRLENYLTGEQHDTSKVQVINFDCAVLIYPTHEQVEEMKKNEGEDDFYTIADDANFYQTRAIELFDSAGVKTAGTQKQFVKFVGDESTWTLDVRKKNLPAWNVILFNKKKGPQPTATISLTYELVKKFYE